MSKKNKRHSKTVFALAACMLLGMTALSGCGGNSGNPGAANATDSGNTANQSADPGNGTDHSKPLTITVFNNAANYQGEQTGWYGKLIKDKFNITLNILSPRLPGISSTKQDRHPGISVIC